MTDWAAGFPRIRWRRDGVEDGERILAEESAVAIVHDASTTAVLMATPRDLEDLAVGFSLTEGIVDDLDQIRATEVVETALGGRHQRAEFSRDWVRVEPQAGDTSLIEVSGQGRKVKVGRYVRPELRPALAHEIRTALRQA